MAPRSLNVVCFRYTPGEPTDLAGLNRLNMELKETLNGEGSIYLTHTKVNDCVTLRMVIAQTDVEQQHVEKAWEHIRNAASCLA